MLYLQDYPLISINKFTYLFLLFLCWKGKGHGPDWLGPKGLNLHGIKQKGNQYIHHNFVEFTRLNNSSIFQSNISNLVNGILHKIGLRLFRKQKKGYHKDPIVNVNKIDLDINAGRNSTEESSNEKFIHKIVANAVKAKEITEENGTKKRKKCENNHNKYL